MKPSERIMNIAMEYRDQMGLSCPVNEALGCRLQAIIDYLDEQEPDCCHHEFITVTKDGHHSGAGDVAECRKCGYRP